ncbi:MAG: RNA 2',3'-cyclic phosphodiesterase [Maritimibacter sp.]
MRAFLALDIPEDLLVPLTRLQAGLSVGRVVPEENLHLTLAFLGEISEAQARDLAEALSLFRHPAIDLTLSGLDLFGGKRPDVLFIGGHGDGLAHLQEKIAHMVREAGIALPRSRFRPHVTLARYSVGNRSKEQAKRA